MANANQPPSLGEIGEEPLRARGGKRKGDCSLLDGKWPCDAPNQRREKMSIPGRDSLGDYSSFHYGSSFHSVEDSAVSISLFKTTVQGNGTEGTDWPHRFGPWCHHPRLRGEGLCWLTSTIGRRLHAGSQTTVPPSPRYQPCQPTVHSWLPASGSRHCAP